MTADDLWKVSLAITLLAAAGSAYAASEITGTTVLGSSTFMPSAHVTVTAAADDTSFSAYSQHLNGNKIYFCTSGSLTYYYSTKVSGTVVHVNPTPSQAVPSGWSTL